MGTWILSEDEYRVLKNALENYTSVESYEEDENIDMEIDKKMIQGILEADGNLVVSVLESQKEYYEEKIWNLSSRSSSSRGTEKYIKDLSTLNRMLSKLRN